MTITTPSILSRELFIYCLLIVQIHQNLSFFATATMYIHVFSEIFETFFSRFKCLSVLKIALNVESITYLEVIHVDMHEKGAFADNDMEKGDERCSHGDFVSV
ncbi:hypothetical protein ACJX0J_016165, partial [Zea mays]